MLKINIGKNDLCYNCRYGKDEVCPASAEFILKDGKLRVKSCRCFIPKDFLQQEEDEKESGATEKSKRFKKPSVEEVKAFCEERGFDGFDAQRFVDYYESVGWKIGRTGKPMKDWKRTVQTWVRENKQKEKEKAAKSGKLSSAPTYDISRAAKDFYRNTEI